MNKIPFKDLPDTTTPVDADNLNLLQDNVSNDINDINSRVNKKIEVTILKTISATEPIECLEGEIYYNTTNNLLYTAVSDDNWDPIGESPVDKCLYLNSDDHSLYYYNGNDLVDYGRKVIDSLETPSSTNPPSVDAVNSALTDIDEAIDALTASLADRDPVVLWRNPNRNVAFGAQTINLSSEDYDYLEIYYWDWSESATKGYWDLQCQKVIKYYNTTLFTAIMYNGKAYMGVRKLVYNSPVKYNAEVCYGLVQDSQFILGENNVWCIPVIILGYKANRTG